MANPSPGRCGDIRRDRRVVLKVAALSLLLPLVRIAAAADEAAITHETVVVPSGALQLKAFLWRPKGTGPFPVVLFNHGSGSSDAMHTGPFVITEAAEKLGPIFVRHGYAFLYLFRRGQGLSADQGPFMQDVLQSEETARGKEARQHLQFVLMTTDHLDDVLAGLTFLKSLPSIDSHRMAMVGHSFGGQLTLLAAERDSSVRAAITFGAAAASWKNSSEVRECLLAAVRKTNSPIMLVHAANDYSTIPGKIMAEELDKLGRPHLLKIYPPVGKTPDDGHNFVYTTVGRWENDVFKFLDQQLR
ncbi:MAG TPA: prolyl oligopeptidase family serine peptidase [Chthoniobacterales bacterium]|nr:prolyl oligopeptidase family serine peptidase [Chthoniobacterales bacterium]